MNTLFLSAFGNKMGVDKVPHNSHHLHWMLPQRHDCSHVSFCTLAISHHMKSELLLKHNVIWAAFLGGGGDPPPQAPLKLAVFNRNTLHF